MTASLRIVIPSVTAAMLVTGGLVGCGSEAPASQPQPPGTVPAGTANVSIEGREAATGANVSCQTIGTVTTVKSGNDEAGLTAVVSSEPALTLQSISINNLGGFSGSYNEGLGDAAEVAVVGRTYQLSGVADGFDIDNPSFRTSGKFSVHAAC